MSSDAKGEELPSPTGLRLTMASKGTRSRVSCNEGCGVACQSAEAFKELGDLSCQQLRTVNAQRMALEAMQRYRNMERRGSAPPTNTDGWRRAYRRADAYECVGRAGGV